MKFGIGAKLALLLTAFSVLASGLTGFYSYTQSRDALIATAESELLSLTLSLGRRVTLNLDDVARHARLLSVLPVTLQYADGQNASLVRQELEEAFASVLAVKDEYTQLRLISAHDHGRELARVERDADGKGIVISGAAALQEKGHFPYVFKALKLQAGEIYLSQVALEHEAGSLYTLHGPNVELATPVFRADGKAFGLIVINVDLKNLFEQLQEDLPSKLSLYLSNKQGDYLIHPDASRTFSFDRGQRQRVQDEFPATASLSSAPNATAIAHVEKSETRTTDQVATFIKISLDAYAPDRYLLLGLSRPLEVVVKSARQLGETILQIIIALSLLAALLAWAVSRLVTGPMATMVRAVRHFGTYHEAVALPTERRDELGVLARNIEDMQSNLQSHFKKLADQETHLHYLAHFDLLTELPNRVHLLDRLRHALAIAERGQRQVAVVFIDLDNFKDINDSLGHGTGDKILQAVAKRLVNTVRQEDTAARLGGDEFVILVEDFSDNPAVSSVAAKLLHSLQTPFELEGRHFYVNASIGISIFPPDGTDAATLIRNADAAMYRAKADGRNTYRFYTEDMTSHVYHRLTIENDLRRAIDNHELVLFYQPQIDLQSGRIRCLEGLIRWQHPERGLLSPASFLPAADNAGLIVQIDHWALRQACQQMRQWKKDGFTMDRVAVNLSGKQIRQADLARSIIDTLHATKCSPSWLELEVTEDFFMERADQAIAELKVLRNIGVALAIDDFGTGYSSLSHLKHLPIDTLKIDRSFIRDIPGDRDDMAIAAAIIALAKKLGLNVTAEGIETEAQEVFVRAEGCDIAQGFRYSRPLPVAEVNELLRRDRMLLDLILPSSKNETL